MFDLHLLEGELPWMKSCQLLPPASLDSLLRAVLNTDPTQLTVAHVKILIQDFLVMGDCKHCFSSGSISSGSVLLKVLCRHDHSGAKGSDTKITQCSHIKDSYCTIQQRRPLSNTVSFPSFLVCHRKQFGRPLAANQLIQKKLADMVTEVHMFNPFSHNSQEH